MLDRRPFKLGRGTSTLRTEGACGDDERTLAKTALAAQTSALNTAHLQLCMADRMASIGTLAAGLGHDMNNVLLPVRARLNALKAAGDLGRISAAELKHVEEIRRSIAYLQQLADGLHYLALDPDDPGLTNGEHSTDLRRWWSQTGPLLAKAVPGHVRVSSMIPEGLPRISIAAHALTQAVLNLVVNAGESIARSPSRKRRQGHVRVWAERSRHGEGWLRFGVTDNGPGMTEETRRRAFEMFFTTKPRGLGTGLGLPLVRKVIERAGGTVKIVSEAGPGTTVVALVPALRHPHARTGGSIRAAVPRMNSHAKRDESANKPIPGESAPALACPDAPACRRFPSARAGHSRAVRRRS